MESTLLGSFLNLFIDPVVASCLIGLIGFTSYVVVNKRLNQILDLDDLEYIVVHHLDLVASSYLVVP